MDEEQPEESAPEGDIYIVATSHASEKSSQEVHEVVEKTDPDMVAIELDKARLQRLTSTEADSSEASVKDIIKNSNIGWKGTILLLLFSRLQSTVATKLGIDMVGLDMLAGYEAAKKRELPLALVDQNVQQTFRRFTEEITIRELFRTVFYFILGYIQLLRTPDSELADHMEAEDIEIEMVLDELESIFPTFKKVFIDERDTIIANRTASIAKQHDTTVLVLGAGHEPGVSELLEEKYPDVTLQEVDVGLNLETN